MKIKNLLITPIAIFGLALISNAQIPNYVPTDGLVGWWPFNGNANDESFNGNNGNVNGATLAIDRFGNANKAYYFDGINNFISVSDNNSFDFQTTNEYSISYWINPESISTSQACVIANKQTGAGSDQNGWNSFIEPNSILNFYVRNGLGQPYSGCNFGQVSVNNSYHVVQTFNSDSVKVYLNGLKVGEASSNGAIVGNNSNPLLFGKASWTSSNTKGYNGVLDDIGIWNRALTQEEISNLYIATNCSNNLTISALTNQLQTGSTATFTATTSDPNPNYIWQSDFGQGYVTLNNYGNYSGVNTNSLSISNVQLSEHNQPIRVISTSGECIDTSNVATINITDTCIVTINDTITTLISVTDTLVINTLITGLTPPNNSNTIKVFPNPANSHITIDFGNFESMNGYTLTITNSIGQTVYTTPITEQSSYIDLSTWGGNGIYFVQLIDTQNNTIENRKIVLQ
jgi:hypothetical protein